MVVGYKMLQCNRLYLRLGKDKISNHPGDH